MIIIWNKSMTFSWLYFSHLYFFFLRSYNSTYYSITSLLFNQCQRITIYIFLIDIFFTHLHDLFNCNLRDRFLFYFYFFKLENFFFFISQVIRKFPFKNLLRNWENWVFIIRKRFLYFIHFFIHLEYESWININYYY